MTLHEVEDRGPIAVGVGRRTVYVEFGDIGVKLSNGLIELPADRGALREKAGTLPAEASFAEWARSRRNTT